MKVKDERKIPSNYGGFVPNSSKWTPAKISSKIDSKEFFERYVKTRTPVILNGLEGNEWKVSYWKDLNYLKEKAGKSVIDVEKKDQSGQFGKGSKQKMLFSQFIDLIKKGNEDYYMTTQIIEEDQFGLPSKLL